MKYIWLLLIPMMVNACEPLPKGVQTLKFSFEYAASLEKETVLLETIKNRLNSFYEHPFSVQKLGENEFELKLAGMLEDEVLETLVATTGSLFFAETSSGRAAAQQFQLAGLIDKFGDKLQLAPDMNDENYPVIGFAKAQDTAMLSSEIRRAERMGIIPADLSVAWGQVPIVNGAENANMLELFAIKKGERKYQGLAGDMIESAKAEANQYGGWAVMLSFDEAGTLAWAEMTDDRVGNFIAMLIDGKAWSVPKVNSPITGGQTMITADWDQEYASLWAAILAGGSLPAKIKITSMNFDSEEVFKQ